MSSTSEDTEQDVAVLPDTLTWSAAQWPDAQQKYTVP